MGQENSSGSQTLCYINAAGAEECFRNEYSSTNDYNMGFDLVARNPTQRAMVLQNLLEEEEDRLKLFGNTLVAKTQLQEKLPPRSCFAVTMTDDYQHTTEWICQDDLENFWRNKCLFGACEEVEELHRLFLGQCVEVWGTHVCPSEVRSLDDIDDDELRPAFAKIGDTILGYSDIAHAMRGTRCFKAAQTFFCEDDIAKLFKTGCFHVHHHNKTEHKVLNVCGEDFVKLLYGDVISVDGTMIKAHFSSDFNDLSNQCIQTEPSHYMCWQDIDDLYHQNEECALYGKTWVCYLEVRHAWQHGSCLKIDGNDVCDHDFTLVAQRKCATLDDGKTYCPTAYGMRTPKIHELEPYMSDPDILREDELYNIMGRGYHDQIMASYSPVFHQ